MYQGKELVISCIEGLLGERVPVLPPMQTYYANKMAAIKSREMVNRPGKVARAQVDIALMCGFDGIDTSIDTLSVVEACGSKVSFPLYGPPFMVKPALDDLKMVKDLKCPDPRKDRRFQSSIRAAELIILETGDDLFSYATLCAPFTLAAELRGLDMLFSDLDKHPEEAIELLSYSLGSLERYIDECCALGIDALVLADPSCSRDFVPEAIFLEFALPGLRECIRRVKARGKYAAVHMCGNSIDMIRHLCGSDADIFWIDVDLSNIPDCLDEKTVMGNLSSDLLSHGSQSDVFSECVKCMELMSARRYILGAGCIFPLSARIENLRTMRKASEYHSLIEP